MPSPSPTKSIVAEPPTTFKAALLRTVQGRLIGALLIIALVLGIAAEIISLVTGYYSMRKIRVESNAATSTLFSPPDRFADEVREVINGQRDASAADKAKMLRTRQTIAEHSTDRVRAYVDVAWQAFIMGDFQAADKASAIAYDGYRISGGFSEDNTLAVATRAHALMLLGRDDEALKLYLSGKNNLRLWNQQIYRDFNNLRYLGLSRPLMETVEIGLGLKPQ
jgi:hypothetical protein